MPRAPLTEDQKQVLRDRLARAREAKKLKPPKEKGAKVAAATPAPAPLRHDNLYTPWTENQWMSAAIDNCRSRLALLKVDFEVGSRIVGQRADVNDPHTYRCFVCNNPIPESKWIWKHDYLDRLTNLFKSVVICSQTCHTVYSTDVRLQRALKDLISGVPSETPSPEPEESAA